jgi:RHH-type transcriptional regulator, proline utilization regulon repressor / proline dehydrogenase / delta 1-pyrroline-5-carboxylate dehydrogenase
MAVGGVAAPLATRAIRANITEMARRFICETDHEKAVKVLAELAENNFTFTADILGEASTSSEEAEQYVKKYQKLIETLSGAAKNWPENPLLDQSYQGAIPKANISVKISAMDPLLDPADHKGSVARLKERLLPLLKKAKQENVFINFDLEQWACHDITFELFKEIATHPDLIDWPHLGLVIQAYLKVSSDDLDSLLNFSKKRQTPFTIRLVKGAYWDYEVVNARQNGFKCPVFTNKKLTDLNYEILTRKLIENHELVSSAFASHNLRSLLNAVIICKHLGLPKNAIELQMLYGMAEPQRQVLAGDGYRVRVYAPIGELLPGMAYLVRRLLENTSNSGFLRQSYHEGIAISEMLAPPVAGPELEEQPQAIPMDLRSPFTNTRFLDFTDSKTSMIFSRALETVEKKLPVEVRIGIVGKEEFSQERHLHMSPNDNDLLISKTAMADTSMVQRAIAIAKKAYPGWRDKKIHERAMLLEKLAKIMEDDRFELAALQVHEVGKPIKEADGDVAEAIDFCRYYARQALHELGSRSQGSMAGEDNILFYEGRGPTAIISPWNFPLAILCGMTTAALVAGNPVLIKPATPASATAYGFYHKLLEAGFPEEIIHFLPGQGKEIGNYLVEHPDVSQIAFTGSMEVGLSIIKKAGNTLPGQAEVKRVVCEMGGKNAIIVDDDADLDSALKGIMHSAFGYAGQKCSACSRIILVGDIYNNFKERFISACKSLPVCSAVDPVCRLGPVIDRHAFSRLYKIIEQPPDNAKLLYCGKAPRHGYFIPPTIFEVGDPLHYLLHEEFFGPIITIIRAADFKEALQIANSTRYALTGAVYSRSPRNMDMAKKEFKVGNLYLNRSSTGALVDRQPFGGFKMSGIGTKAGGPGYLLNFANPRCITENTIRSGFTPDLQM